MVDIWMTIDVLQRVQNNLARVVYQKRGRTDARPFLRSEVPPLVANQATNHSQDGDIDVQGDVDFNASIPERPDPASCSGSISAVISRPTTDCSTSANWTRSTSILGRGTNMELSAC